MMRWVYSLLRRTWTYEDTGKEVKCQVFYWLHFILNTLRIPLKADNFYVKRFGMLYIEQNTAKNMYSITPDMSSYIRHFVPVCFTGFQQNLDEMKEKLIFISIE